MTDGDSLYQFEKCSACHAICYGNATCSTCVKQWPRLGFSQATVDALLAAIGDRMPDPPFGTRWN